MMGVVDERWLGSLGSTLASIMFVWMAFRQYFPQEFADRYLRKWASRLVSYFSPYVQISFPEYAGERLQRSEAFSAIESYLGSTCGGGARRLRAEMGKESTTLVLSMDEHEEVTDAFEGATFWWESKMSSTPAPRLSFYPQAADEKRFYRLTFHRRHRNLAVERYLPNVVEKGRDASVRRRRRKLYTNSPSRDAEYRRLLWSHVPFEHPASFDTLAMDPEQKRDLMQDLLTFRENKEYYARIGKPWKRGYLLYGPPGTGKSTMVAAMANLLEYDVYDLELTAVKDNSSLRRLLIETTSKSIIVVEDIDCSLDLTGKRKTEGEKSGGDEDERKKMEAAAMGRGDKDDSKVTLSGLLNFIDGLWSACGGERLIVFTTNHVEKLDPALIRRGRMDKHIELSYCRFEPFKVLAKNYLGIHAHPKFEDIRQLMEVTDITPADVAERLIPRTNRGRDEDIDACLDGLVTELQAAKARKEAATAADTGEAAEEQPMSKENQSSGQLGEEATAAGPGEAATQGHQLEGSKVE